jgi:hypothetical protein
VVKDRIHGDFAPQEGKFPHITMIRTTTPRWDALDGPTGQAVPLIQVTCWALTRAQAVELARLVRISRGGNNAGPTLNGFAGFMSYSATESFYVRALKVADERDDNEQPDHADEAVIKYTTLDLSICYDEP